MITTIAEHSVDISLIRENGPILDLGCRGFLFTKEMQKLGYQVTSVDMDRLNEGHQYYRYAITNYTGKCGIQYSGDPQATKIGEADAKVDCYTLQDFNAFVGVKFWDVIKIDIEGAEYEVIMSLKEPPAKQLSIEFHMHCGQTLEQVTEIVAKLESLGYEAVSHELTAQHGAGLNYWDSLFILKL